MDIPIKLLDSLQGLRGFDKTAFEKTHDDGSLVTAIRMNPLKPIQGNSHLAINAEVPWTQYGYYLKERPSFTFDPLFHAGTYYVQEASSMFLETVLKQSVDLSKPLKVLDLCAAPGGKSTHLQSMLSKDSLLVSNEVIKQRVNILRDNIIKWGAGNVVVTNNDPRDFARLEGFFDVIVVDAPCSGSGLFRKEPDAISEWSENNVMLCSQRQQRILADVIPALKNEGILIYSTCSYSREEDEDICQWMDEQLSLENIPLSIKEEWGIVPGGGGYRFWPDKVKGEGFFISCYKKKNGEVFRQGKTKKLTQLNKREMEIIGQWVRTEGLLFIKNNNTVYAFPEKIFQDISLLLSGLHVIYSGIIIGELIRDKLVPGHALAMSTILPESGPAVQLDLDNAINYLKRKDLVLNSGKGWQLVSFAGHNLGWVNVLPNRVNNYYPKELRILRDS